MFIQVLEYQIKYFQAICQTSFMSFPDEVVFSGVRLICPSVNSWANTAELMKIQKYFVIGLSQLKIYTEWLKESV